MFRISVLPVVLTALAVGVQASSPPGANRIIPEYDRLLLTFQENRGQTANGAFLARGPGYRLFLDASTATLVFADDASGKRRDAGPLTLEFVGANRQAAGHGVHPLPGRSHYYIGKREDWIEGVGHYRGVRFLELYPGIDVVYYGNRARELEYDLIVAPGADPEAIHVRMPGAESLELNAEGGVVVGLPDRTAVTWRAPGAYQMVRDRRIPVDSAYRLQNGGLTFRLGPYDPTAPLIIDPVLAYSTFLPDEHTSNDVAVDRHGQAYLAGNVRAAADPASGGARSDAWIAKLNRDGTELLFYTRLGTLDTDQRAHAVTVDAAGNAYVTGSAGCGFPVSGAIQPDCRGGADAFIAKLAADGTLLYSTLLGGVDADRGQAITVDASGHITVAGVTESPDFPVANAHQPALDDRTAGFVTRLAPDGSAFVYSTFFPSAVRAMAVDGVGAVYLAGATGEDFPTLRALQPNWGGGTCFPSEPIFTIPCPDGFVAKIHPAGTLAFATFLGGSGADQALGIDVDPTGRVYVTGVTESVDFPTLNAAPAGAGDAFMVRISGTGESIEHATLLGGSDRDVGAAIAVDLQGHVWIAGSTFSTDFPRIDPIAPPAGSRDGFVARYDGSGARLTFSTTIGGCRYRFDDDSGRCLAPDIARAVAVDPTGAAYVTGITESSDFPTTPGAAYPERGLFDSVEPTAPDGLTLFPG